MKGGETRKKNRAIEQFVFFCAGMVASSAVLIIVSTPLSVSKSSMCGLGLGQTFCFAYVWLFCVTYLWLCLSYFILSSLDAWGEKGLKKK